MWKLVCGHKVDSVLLIMGMINCEGRALELLRLIFSTLGMTPPQGLERQHSFEAKPQPNYIKVGVAIILSRRRIHLAVISETTMPGSLTFRPIFLALLWVNRSLDPKYTQYTGFYRSGRAVVGICGPNQ